MPPGLLTATSGRCPSPAGWSCSSGTVNWRCRVAWFSAVLVTIRYSQVENALSARNRCSARHAETSASWVASSASWVLFSSRSATR